jgi:excisionase family DNA binding protein
MTAQYHAMPPLQTVVEVARYLSVRPATIYRLLSKRTIAELRSRGIAV